MATFWQRIEQVVRSEWGDRRRGHDGKPARAVPSGVPRPDVTSAWRMLELEREGSLLEVRAAYWRLATHYHPRTLDPVAAPSARTVIASLTEALEVLEDHLLPLTSQADDEP